MEKVLTGKKTALPLWKRLPFLQSAPFLQQEPAYRLQNVLKLPKVQRREIKLNSSKFLYKPIIWTAAVFRQRSRDLNRSGKNQFCIPFLKTGTVRMLQEKFPVIPGERILPICREQILPSLTEHRKIFPLLLFHTDRTKKRAVPARQRTLFPGTSNLYEKKTMFARKNGGFILFYTLALLFALSLLFIVCTSFAAQRFSLAQKEHDAFYAELSAANRRESASYGGNQNASD